MIGRLIIRADADGAMGTGHIMRCLALAQAWQEHGGECTFVGCIESEALSRRLVAEGCSVVALSDCHPDAGEIAVLRRLAEELQRQQEDLGWLVLDGYHFDQGYQQALWEIGWKLLVIDDLGQFAEYHCDVLLNQNLYAPALAYSCPAGATILLGPRYALLRREFRQPIADRDFPAQARRVLVTMGGADQHNVTARVLSALAAAKIDGLEVRTVVGAANSHRDALTALLARLPFRCELVCGAEDMVSLMRWADAAVTAAGTTTYELAAVGTPFLTVVTADNQEANAFQLAKQGVAVDLGRHELLDHHALAGRLRKFFDDCLLRRSQAAAGRQMVDGLGAGRVVSAMLARKVILRPACWPDKDLLLEWANDPETRQNSFCPENITPQGHEQWLAAKLAAPDCRLWMAVFDGSEQAGMVRFDSAGNRAEISVNLAPHLRGQGLGSLVIETACARLFQEDSGVERILALIKPENQASLRAFTAAGFAVGNKTQRHGIPAVSLYLERNPHG